MSPDNLYINGLEIVSYLTVWPSDLKIHSIELIISCDEIYKHGREAYDMSV